MTMNNTNTCSGPQCTRPIFIQKVGLCKSHYQQHWAGKPLTVLRRLVKRKPAPAGYLHCTRCDNFKREDQFYMRSTGKPQQHCKECMIADNREDVLARRARESAGATQ